MIKKIILVFKTHFDFGFTDLAANVARQYAGQMLEDVIDACVNTAGLGKLRFVFTLPAWPLQVMLDSGKDQATLVDLIEKGQVVWHALPFTSHVDFAGMEDIIEGLKYARALSQRFGKPLVKSAKMTDVPGHGNMLPSVLAAAGIRFLHLGCNEYPVPPQVPPLFWWQAPDGSRVLTMYYPDGYGDSRLMPEEWPFPVWMAMMHTHDNDGPQRPDDIRALVEKAQAENPGVEIVSGSMDDFYNELEKCDLSGLPVITADLADSWIHGVGSYTKEVAMVRDARQVLDAAEKAEALAGTPPTEGWLAEVDDAWDGLILFDEHTWGLDVKSWMNHERVYEKQAFLKAKSSEEYKYMEASWAEQTERAQKAINSAVRALPQQGAAPALLNPGGASFTGWARRCMGECGPAKDAMPLFGGQYSYVEKAPALAATALAGLGAAAAGAAPTLTGEGADAVFQNHRYAIYLNTDTGVVARVHDKKQGADILAAQGGHGVFSTLYSVYGEARVQRFMDDYCNIDSDWGVLDNGRMNYHLQEGGQWQPEFVDCTLEGNTLVLRYAGTQTERYGDAKGTELRLTLPSVGEELFCEVLLRDKQETPFVEGGSFILPLPQGMREYRINKNGTLLDPRTDIIDGANHVFYCLEGFATAGEESVGLCVVPHHTPLMSIGETGVYTYRRRWQENDNLLYFNLFNNMWGTNFPQWIGGDARFAFTLYGVSPKENTTQRALALFQGARVLPMAAAESPFVLPCDTHVARMKPHKDGVLLRLRDTGGVARSMVVSLKAQGLVLRPMDLQDRPMGTVQAGPYIAEVGPYGMITLWAGTVVAAEQL